MEIELISAISDIEIIAVGNSVYGLVRLRKIYGAGRWRKLKGIAHVRLPDGAIVTAEVHWYEAHGIGKREIKVKRILDE